MTVKQNTKTSPTSRPPELETLLGPGRLESPPVPIRYNNAQSGSEKHDDENVCFHWSLLQYNGEYDSALNWENKIISAEKYSNVCCVV